MGVMFSYLFIVLLSCYYELNSFLCPEPFIAYIKSQAYTNETTDCTLKLLTLGDRATFSSLFHNLLINSEFHA